MREDAEVGVVAVEARAVEEVLRRHAVGGEDELRALPRLQFSSAEHKIWCAHCVSARRGVRRNYVSIIVGPNWELGIYKFCIVGPNWELGI